MEALHLPPWPLNSSLMIYIIFFIIKSMRVGHM